MDNPTFTSFHESAIQNNTRQIQEVGERLDKKLDDQGEKIGKIHAIVTNGLQDKVKNIDKRTEILTDPVKRANTCPVIVSRKKRRTSWEWYLVVGVAITSMLGSIATVVTVFIMLGGVG